MVSTKNPVTDASLYLSENDGSALVNFTLATTEEAKIEAIVTQKYIAHNYIGGHVAWDEFRRTGYPKVVNGGSSTQTFVATKSTATTVDRLPGRILYPSLEYSLNADNVPAGVTVSGSFVFWDRRNK